MGKRRPEVRAAWNEVRLIGLIATGMAILGATGVIYAMTRENPTDALLSALVILSIVSLFCGVVATRMAEIMERLGKIEDD